MQEVYFDKQTHPVGEIRKNKLKRGPKVKYDGGYKQHNQEEKYHLKYYHQHKSLIHCPTCNKEINKLTLKDHQRSKKCIALSTSTHIKLQNKLKDLKALMDEIEELKLKL